MDKEMKKDIERVKKINSISTEKLSKRQLKQLAKYTLEAITTGRVGTFRWLIYDVLKPAVGYADGMHLGLLEFNNTLVDLAGILKPTPPKP